jgi:predicted TIM-barrel fold metal-dependent hydrolase
MIIDIHVHSRPGQRAEEILRGMDAAGVDKLVLFALPPQWEGGPGGPATMDEASEDLAKIAAQGQGRIIPFAWIEPTLPDAVAAVDHAVNDLGFRGVKMIPNHWYPTEERLFPVYAKIEELGVPVLFHAGILWGHADGSRFCHPVYYEVLLHFPKVRFALAHIGWPWVDECLAVAGRFRAAVQGTGQPVQMWIDTTPGTPALWRPEALRKTFAYLGDEQVLWGSDATGTNIADAGRTLAEDRRILREVLGGSAETERRWLGENAARFLGL